MFDINLDDQKLQVVLINMPNNEDNKSDHFHPENLVVYHLTEP